MQNPSNRLWTRSFILVTLANLIIALNLHTILPSLPLYVKGAFQANELILSLLIGAFALSAIASRIFAVCALHSGYRKSLLLFGLGLSAFATIANYWAPSATAILALRVAFGLGFGITTTILPTIATQIIPPRRLGEGIGYFGLSQTLSTALGPLLGLWILQEYGFGPLISLSAGLLLLITPTVLQLPMEPPSHHPPSSPHSHGSTKKPSPLPFFLHLLLALTYGGILNFLALFGKEIAYDGIAIFFLFNAAAILLIRPIAGKLFDRRGPSSVLLPGALLVGGGLWILSASHGLLGVCLSGILYGIGYGAVQSTLHAWLIQQAPLDKRAGANVAFFNSLDIGVTLGAFSLGLVASHSSYGQMYRFSVLFMALFLLLFGLSQLRRPAIGPTPTKNPDSPD